MQASKKIVLSIVVVVVIFIITVLVIRNLSFSKFNVYPRNSIQRYLEKAYNGRFKYLKQEYHKNERYHIWIVYFQDDEDREFKEYFYVKNTRDIIFDGYNEYGRIWDTYACVFLEEKYGEKLSRYNNPDNPYDNLVESHYIFEIKEGQSIEQIGEELGELYLDIFSILKYPSGIAMQWEVRKDNEILTYLYESDIYEGLDKEKVKISKETIKEYIIN